MNCQECELLLAQGESNSAAEDHLRDCPDCRALAEALGANASVLESLREEELPRIEIARPRRKVFHYAAVIAAVAAALVIAMQLPRPHTPQPVVTAPAVSQEGATEPAAAVAALPAPAPVTVPQKLQPLKIKMLTDDPDVVIYWIVD